MGLLDEYTKDGYWEVISAPAEKKEHMINQDMFELVKSCQARHRGWPFPFTRQEDIKRLNDYLQSVTIGEKVPHFEGFRLYESGLFYWKDSMWENHFREYGRNKFSYVAANWKITEIMLFLKRLYTKILDVNDVVDIQIRIVGCKDRYFSSDGEEYNVPWEFVSGKCDENNIILKKSVNNSTLKASWQDIAVEFIRKLCLLFKANNVNDEIIRDLQNRLLKMKLI